MKKKKFSLISLLLATIIMTVGLAGCTPDPIDPERPERPVLTYFDVKIGNLTNGTIRAIPEQAVAGERVNLLISPNKGYSLASGSIRWNGHEEISTYQGIVTFIMPPEDVTVTAQFDRLAESTTYNVIIA